MRIDVIRILRSNAEAERRLLEREVTSLVPAYEASYRTQSPKGVTLKRGVYGPSDAAPAVRGTE